MLIRHHYHFLTTKHYANMTSWWYQKSWFNHE